MNVSGFTDKYLVKLFGYALMLVMVVLSLAPFVWIFISSFKTNTEIFADPFLIPGEFSLKNYAEAIRISKLQLMYVNSLVISTTATVVSVGIYMMVAYALGRYRFPGSRLIFGILISSILIPSNAMVQPVYTVIRRLNLYDTRLGLILIYAAFGLPTALFVMKSYFENLPKEIEEAAEIEGAGFVTIFWQIMMPLAKPAIACSLTLIYIFSWNEFMYAMLMTSTEKSRTLPVALKYFTAEFSFNNAALFAAVIMVVIPSILIYSILQNQIMESMVAGAVKG